MSQRILQFAVLFAASLLTLPAQDAQQSTPMQARPTQVSGITIPPISGAPFSATVVIEAEREFFYGSAKFGRTIDVIARDSKGHTHNEVRRIMPLSFHGSPQVLEVRLYDPITHIRTICDPGLKLARQEYVPEQAKTVVPPNPQVHIEDLGTDTFNGVQAKGTRRTLTLEPDVSGWSDTIDIQDEEWYSQDLHLVLLVRHDDPRVGVQTVGVSGLKREEPPASLFQVPAGYKILDPIPAPPAAVPSSGPATR